MYSPFRSNFGLLLVFLRDANHFVGAVLEQEFRPILDLGAGFYSF
jgi:hypothetical protein